MKKLIFIFLTFCVVPIMVYGQDEFHINDEIELYNIFSVVDSKMLDTSSIRFQDAKRNVLRYCSENLTFDIDSTAILYSCREYMDVNPYALKKERKIIKRENLKYKFFISFKIQENIIYHTSYYLDTAMSVHYSSKWIYSINSNQLWNIISWDSISEEISKFENEYVLPIKEIDIEYSEEHEKFVYIILQQKTEKTIVNETSDYSGNYEINKLIVDAENGTVLEKTKKGYSYIAQPSW
jgi:hypothetical protein